MLDHSLRFCISVALVLGLAYGNAAKAIAGPSRSRSKRRGVSLP
jgi:hypothetical protein